jgi:hypothetical protein
MHITLTQLLFMAFGATLYHLWSKLFSRTAREARQLSAQTHGEP